VAIFPGLIILGLQARRNLDEKNNTHIVIGMILSYGGIGVFFLGMVGFFLMNPNVIKDRY
jgi:hypothetical protein